MSLIRITGPSIRFPLWQPDELPQPAQLDDDYAFRQADRVDRLYQQPLSDEFVIAQPIQLDEFMPAPIPPAAIALLYRQPIIDTDEISVVLQQLDDDYLFRQVEKVDRLYAQPQSDEYVIAYPAVLDDDVPGLPPPAAVAIVYRQPATDTDELSITFLQLEDDYSYRQLDRVDRQLFPQPLSDDYVLAQSAVLDDDVPGLPPPAAIVLFYRQPSSDTDELSIAPPVQLEDDYWFRQLERLDRLYAQPLTDEFVLAQPARLDDDYAFRQVPYGSLRWPQPATDDDVIAGGGVQIFREFERVVIVARGHRLVLSGDNLRALLTGEGRVLISADGVRLVFADSFGRITLN